MSMDKAAAKYAITAFGSGNDPMVFAHGLGCSQAMWSGIAPAFAHSHKVILFDLMGFGGSDLRYFSYDRYQSLGDYADDFIELLEASCSQPATLVAHSVSAMIGVLASIKRPELFRRLVLIGPSPRYIDDGQQYQGGFREEDIKDLIEAMRSNYLGWAEQLAPVIMGNTERPELVQTLHESFCRTHPDIAQHVAALTFWSDNRADLPLAKTRALVMQCANDVIAPKTVGEYVAANMPNATFLQLKATGHCPHVSHPAEVINGIRAYVSSSDAPI